MQFWGAVQETYILCLFLNLNDLLGEKNLFFSVISSVGCNFLFFKAEICSLLLTVFTAKPLQGKFDP